MRLLDFFGLEYSTFKLVLAAGDEREEVHLDPSVVCCCCEYFEARFGPHAKFALTEELRLDEICPSRPKDTISVVVMLLRAFYDANEMVLVGRQNAWGDAIILLLLCDMLRASREFVGLAKARVAKIMDPRDRDTCKRYLADLVPFVATGVWNSCVDDLLKDVYAKLAWSDTAASRVSAGERRVMLVSVMDAVPDELRAHYLMHVVEVGTSMAPVAMGIMIEDATTRTGEALAAYVYGLRDMGALSTRLQGVTRHDDARGWCNALDAMDISDQARARFVYETRAMLLNAMLKRRPRSAKRKRADAVTVDEVEKFFDDDDDFEPADEEDEEEDDIESYEGL